MFEDYLEKVMGKDYTVAVVINRRHWKITIEEFKDLWEGKVPDFFRSFYRGNTLIQLDRLTYQVTK